MGDDGFCKDVICFAFVCFFFITELICRLMKEKKDFDLSYHTTEARICTLY